MMQQQTNHVFFLPCFVNQNRLLRVILLKIETKMLQCVPKRSYHSYEEKNKRKKGGGIKTKMIYENSDLKGIPQEWYKPKIDKGSEKKKGLLGKIRHDCLKMNG